MQRLDGVVRYAQALNRAREALADAERRQAPRNEQLDLADVVIGARCELAAALVEAGWSPPPEVASQMERDHHLVDEKVGPVVTLG
jgi:hypothetical protein